MGTYRPQILEEEERERKGNFTFFSSAKPIFGYMFYNIKIMWITLCISGGKLWDKPREKGITFGPLSKTCFSTYSPPFSQLFPRYSTKKQGVFHGDFETFFRG